MWFTSDTHFGHTNVIRYSNRPFKDAVDMDEEMIQRWNETVGPNDDVFHLGDFSMGKSPAGAYLERLNGNKHLIWGNHDSRQVRRLDDWDSSQPYLELKEDGKLIVLSHYAMRVWNKSHHGSIMLYGHSHGTLPGNSQSVDVGVDNGWDYRPITLDQINERLKTLPEYAFVDHHRASTP